MLPIVWRYLLAHYLKVLCLCLVTFIAVLLTTRLGEIAHFATLGPEGIYILLFTLHQIPYIVPIALPIACAISSVILVQRLSRTHELTALRAAGMSLSALLAPILIAAGILSVANFYVVSELSTNSHLAAGLLKTELRAINPLLLLHNKHLLKMKGIFFRTLGPSKMGESVEDAILALPNKKEERIHLLLTKKMRASSKRFVSQGVTLLTSLEGENDLAVENIGDARMTVQDFGQMMQKKVWTLSNDHLQMPLLLAKLHDEKLQLAKVVETNPGPAVKAQQRCVTRCYSEILRRLSLGIAIFSFTLMGAAFGISISRNPSNRGVAAVIILAAITLISFFVAKGIEDQLFAAATLYLAPHLLIMIASLWTLRRANQGIE